LIDINIDIDQQVPSQSLMPVSVEE